MATSQNPRPSAASLQNEVLHEFQVYHRKGRISDMPPLRLLIAILMLFFCLTATLMLYGELKKGAQVSMVTTAAKQGDLAQMKKLVKSHPKLVDAPGYLGRSPLWWAAAMGRINVMKFCIAKKVNLNRKDIDGGTPLHAAAAHDQVASIQLLAQSRADFTARDKLGRTILHAAATGPNMNAAATLIAMGFSPDLTDNLGWSTLHVAVFYRQAKMVTFLLNNHASVNQKRNDGLTPLALANQMKHNDAIIDILMSNGGDT